MTRLISQDIDQISKTLFDHEKQLIASTRHGLLEIGCRCYEAEVDSIKQQVTSLEYRVVPVTTGLGIISCFSETVAAILRFLGFSARVTRDSDVAGVAEAMEERVDGIFMADDLKFIGINCNNKNIVDNGDATGQMYATTLHLMVGGISAKDILVAGCGPVGRSAAERLLRFGGQVALIDSDVRKSVELKDQLEEKLHLTACEPARIRSISDLDKALVAYDYILDATPESCLISDNYLTKNKFLAIPGVPPGISEYGFNFLANHVIHDKLELGVAGMAVGLLS